MLPSKARVGDTIHFSFPHANCKGKTITAFEVIVNGKRIANPEKKMTSAVTGGATSFVFQAALRESFFSGGMVRFHGGPSAD